MVVSVVKEHYDYNLVHKFQTFRYVEIQQVSQNMVLNNLKIDPNMYVWMLDHIELMNVFRITETSSPPPTAPPEYHARHFQLCEQIRIMKTDPPTLDNHYEFSVMGVQLVLKPTTNMVSGLYRIDDNERPSEI